MQTAQADPNSILRLQQAHDESSPSAVTARDPANQDIPQVLVTGSRVPGFWLADWQAGLLQGGAQAWLLNVGYNGFYNGARWALAFTQQSAEIAGDLVGAVDGALAARSAVRGGAALLRVAIGQAGEDAVRAVVDIGPKVPIVVNGITLIPDGLTATTLSEVKNVGYLSYKKQLRGFAQYAADNHLRFDLYVRSTTKFSGPLAKAIRSGSINLQLIPGL